MQEDAGVRLEHARPEPEVDALDERDGQPGAVRRDQGDGVAVGMRPRDRAGARGRRPWRRGRRCAPRRAAPPPGRSIAAGSARYRSRSRADSRKIAASTGAPAPSGSRSSRWSTAARIWGSEKPCEFGPIVRTSSSSIVRRSTGSTSVRWASRSASESCEPSVAQARDQPGRRSRRGRGRRRPRPPGAGAFARAAPARAGRPRPAPCPPGANTRREPASAAIRPGSAASERRQRGRDGDAFERERRGALERARKRQRSPALGQRPPRRDGARHGDRADTAQPATPPRTASAAAPGGRGRCR